MKDKLIADLLNAKIKIIKQGYNQIACFDYLKVKYHNSKKPEFQEILKTNGFWYTGQVNGNFTTSIIPLEDDEMYF